MGNAEPNAVSSPKLPAIKVAVMIVYMAGIFAAMLFIPAGRLNWTLGWIYLGIVITFVIINWVCLSRWNPELIRRRMRYGRGTKQWDKVWTLLFAPVLIAVYVVAGLEVRWDAGGLPMSLWPVGLAIFCLGSIVLVWSMVVNPFFEKTVRIQTEQGHRVIDSGPYAWVRHPGYVGFTSWILATPLLLGSAWALIPAASSILAILIRTSLEDRTLRAELTGYRDYAARVRYRIIPGLW
jgi:protein-S-isoprenylcysteine O-methyltransferase Ste14